MLPASLTYVILCGPDAANLGDLMQLWVRADVFVLTCGVEVRC